MTATTDEYTRSVYDEVAQRLKGNPEFVEDFTRLIVLDVQTDILRSQMTSEQFEYTQIRRLAEAATTLACSKEDDNRAIAYQLAFLLAKNYAGKYPGLNAVARLVFARIGNFPAEDLLSNEGADLPLIPATERVAKKLDNTLVVGDQEFTLTDFQAAVVERLEKSLSVSVSGPTSSGKSFLITQFIVKACLEHAESFSVAVVVPTRALIQQFQRDLDNQFKALSYRDVEFITSTFAKPRGTSKRVYIVTQERLQFILQRNREFFVHLLIVDEAQNLDDQGRGIILENTIAEVLNRSSTTQVVFLAPLANNPGSLLGRFNIERGDQVATLLSPVTQNVFDLTVSDRVIELSLLLNNAPVPIIEGEIVPGSVDIKEPTNMVAFLASRFCGGQPTIIYCNTPEDAEVTASALLPYGRVVSSERIEAFTEFLADYIHPDYYLIDLLRHGIGFHYGNMPEVVKTYVEFLFKERELLFLCCTSTLLEGVNLPAKNIFIYKPKAGNSDMNDPEFWNLAGRAGRLRAEFSGNVFCINPHEWKRSVDERERTYELKSALSRAFADKDLPTYILTEKLRATKARVAHLQQAVSYLVPRIMDVGRSSVEQYLVRRGVFTGISTQQIEAVLTSVESLATRIELPSRILRENGSLDPRRLERLREYLFTMPVSQLRELIPAHPAQKGSYERLERIFKLLEEVIEDPKSKPTYKADTYMAYAWMREESLSEIIRGKIAFVLRQPRANEDSRELVNKCIRNVIKSLNKRVRFDLVRFVKCYTDVISHVLRETDLVETIETNLPGYLEIGAYRPSTLALINVGVSRMTAILIANRFPAADIVDDPVSWLHKNRGVLQILLPEPCYEDIDMF